MNQILLSTLIVLNSLVSVFAQSPYWIKSSPYELSLKNDLIIGGISISTLIFGWQIEKNEKAPLFEPGSFTQQDIDKINFIDRGVAGRWDLDAKDAGKIFKRASTTGVQIALALLPGYLKSRGSLYLIYLEGYFLTGGLTALAKGTTDRYRPFAYLTLDQIDNLEGEAREEFLEDIADDDIEDSFFSGDASSTAYGLIFFAKVFNDYFPDSKLKYGIWGVSITGTTLGAYFRVKSGKHFPTDVIVGSLVGGSIGFFIPHLHKKFKGQKLSLLPSNDGLSLIYKF